MNKDIIKEFDLKVNAVVAYAVGGEWGGVSVKDCKKDLKDVFLKTLKSQRKEIVEKIKKEYQLLGGKDPYEETDIDGVIDVSEDNGYNKALNKIINLITKQDE